MAINYEAVLRLNKPDAGTPSWATYWHRNMDILGGMFGGKVTVTKVTGATTLPDADGTADSGKKLIITTTKVLTGNVQVTVPARNRIILAENLSSGAFNWKIQVGSNGVNVPQGRRMWLRSTTTGVIPISRTDLRATATEIGVSIITASHITTSAITATKIAAGAITLPKLAGAGSYGRILVSATTAGFPFTTLARGTANQELAMSTAAAPKPAWRDSPYRKVATSTGMSFSVGDVKTFTHGITGIANKYDYRLVQLIFECISADIGYSVGDVVFFSDDCGSSNQGAHAVADAVTAVKALISSAGIVFFNKSTQAAAAITASRWVLRIRVGV